MSIDYCADELRQHAYAHYVIPLLLPRSERAKLWALFAFELELSRVPSSAKEPMLQRIRYQWWREAIDRLFQGKPDKHPVIQALAADMIWIEKDFEELIASHEDEGDRAPILLRMTQQACDARLGPRIARIYKAAATETPDGLLPLKLWFKTLF